MTRSGWRPLDDREDVGAVEGLADDLEAAVGLERVVDSRQHEPVIVCDDDTAGSERRECRQTAALGAGQTCQENVKSRFGLPSVGTRL